MSTAGQVRKLLQPFLARHPEFVSIKRGVVLAPIRHVMRGIYIDRSSIKAYVVPSWFVSVMFRAPTSNFSSFGRQLDRAVGFLGRPDAQDRLMDEMERASAEILTGAGSLKRLFEVAEKSSFGLHRETKCLLLAALGRFAEAQESLDHHIAFLRQQHDSSTVAWGKLTRVGSKNWQRQMQFRQWEAQLIAELEQLRSRVIDTDRKAVAVLLHEWEAIAAGRRKIEHLWEPTPFPVELGEGD